MRILIIAALLLSSSTAFSQSAGFGIKGGLNYGATGDLTTFGDFVTNITVNGEDKLGYHVGAFGKFEFSGLFVQPEIVFTKLSTSFDSGNIIISNTDYNLTKIDIPLLVGLKIAGPLNIKAGPSFQYILNNDLDGFDIDEPENSLTLGYQIGAGVTLGQLGIDIRYEGAFSDNTAIAEGLESNEFGFEIDTRPSQWILSISYAFKKK